ncbi:MAG: haloacid dehalogenase type II [Betaproteobacteria bacterium]|jgi:2-haloacid dehalogenase
MYKIIAFDAFGTIFDVYSIGKLAEEYFPHHGQSLSIMWRDRQIEYTRLVSMADPLEGGSRHYVSFWELTIQALRYCCSRLGLALTPEIENRLMGQYAQLEIFSDVLPCLQAIHQQQIQTAILSNGSQEMLNTVVERNHISSYFEQLISVDEVRHFKVMPMTYELILKKFDCQKKDVLFVSCNAWDIVGAAWFGLPTFWVNRHQLPYETIGLPPTYQGSGLADLLQYL